MLGRSAVGQKGRHAEGRFIELQQVYGRLQRGLATKEQDAMGGLMKKLQTAVGQIAEREKIALVLERNSSVVWGQPSLDITNEVIRLYNSMDSSSKPKK